MQPLGITHSIRSKLNFLDDRKWKRFSARRLEMIDTLDLSHKKASEQEAQIRKVAQALQIEFNYSLEYFEDFEKLVRAAVQSVRRNRKRSTKTRRADTFRVKLQQKAEAEFQRPDSDSDNREYLAASPNFNISEIAKLTSDSLDDSVNYTKFKTITDFDKSRLAINSIVQPKITSASPTANETTESSLQKALHVSRNNLINYIKKSRTCSEAVTNSTPNLEFLGKGAVITSVGYVFEKSFKTATEKSLDYLRNKLTLELFLARLYREMDKQINDKLQINDETAMKTLYTILGACITDFGFNIVLNSLCEWIYWNVIREYPLMAETSKVFRGLEYNEPETKVSQLNSLAAVASNIRTFEQNVLKLQLPVTEASESSTIRWNSNKNKTDKIAVRLHFLSSVLNFSFPITNSAIPKLNELLENARTAFNLSKYNESHVLVLKDLKAGKLVLSDSDIERIFTTQNPVELEVFNQPPHAVPPYEITSLVIPNKYQPAGEKIHLPPPIPGKLSLESVPMANTNFKFLSNLEESSTLGPPAPVLPKFQPLL